MEPSGPKCEAFFHVYMINIVSNINPFATGDAYMRQLFTVYNDSKRVKSTFDFFSEFNFSEIFTSNILFTLILNVIIISVY